MVLNNDQHITLKEGLQRFYNNYVGELSHKDDNLPEDVRAFFNSHDIAHVVFGCDISLFGEGSLKLWTIFGTDLGFWKHIIDYKKANAFELSKTFRFLPALRDVFKLIISAPLLMIRASRMRKRWPWTSFEIYMDIPIADIRWEFNINTLS